MSSPRCATYLGTNAGWMVESRVYTGVSTCKLTDLALTLDKKYAENFQVTRSKGYIYYPIEKMIFAMLYHVMCLPQNWV
jgi:hypothetical protein